MVATKTQQNPQETRRQSRNNRHIWPLEVLMQRFWAKVERTSSCWLWSRGVFTNGYGCFFDGRRNVQAHRMSYELVIGQIPRGMLVRHVCDVRRCVRPEHLILGTHEDNVADQVERRARISPPSPPQRRQIDLPFGARK